MNKKNQFGLQIVATIVVMIILLYINSNPKLLDYIIPFVSKFGFALFILIVLYWIFNISNDLQTKIKTPKNTEYWPKKNINYDTRNKN